MWPVSNSAIWDFITTQFRFSQDGMSQSWLFWTIVLVGVVLKKCWKNGFSKK